MTSPSPARGLRRFTAGAALILFPVLMAVETAFDPALTGTGEVMYTAATEHAGALAASGLMLLVIGLLMTPAGMGILHQARDRGAALGNLGAALAVLAGLRFAGMGIFYLLSLSLAGGDRVEMVAYVERINSGPVFGILVIALALCAHLSLIVLPWAAWRAGLSGIWAPVVATVVTLAHFVVPANPAFDYATFAALACVFGYLGLRILRMTDAEWDGTPAPTRTDAPVRA